MARSQRWIPTLVALFAVACASAPTGPQVIAHRGASGLAPEHTLAAFDLAIELGADWIEQDLHLTRDGVLVVVHDETLDRTARGPAESCTGPVRSRTPADLERCDFGAWFDEGAEGGTGRFRGERIVTLDALFARYGRRTRYYIETKHPEHTPGVEEALVSLLARHDLLPRGDEPDRVIIQSFSPESLRRVRQLDSRLPLVQLVHGDLEGPIDEVFSAIAS